MIHIITLGFSPARIIRLGMEKFYKTQTLTKGTFKHYLVDQHYPLRRDENLAEMKKIADEYGLTWLDSGKDRGLHHGLNWTLDQIKPAEDDVMINFDPDSGPTISGWDIALVETIRAGYALACSCDDRSLLELNERGYRQEWVKGCIRIWTPVTNCLFSIVAWDCGFIRKMGGFDEENAYYGGLESYVWHHLNRLGRKWAYLPDFIEENSSRAMTDLEYTSYKWCHAHHRNFKGSFAEYLAAGMPGYLGDVPPP